MNNEKNKAVITISFLSRVLGLFLLASFSLFSQISYKAAFPNIQFNFPVEIQHANDNSNRLFVLEQNGIIKVFPNSSDVTPNQVSDFLDIRDRVRFSAGQEIGLLGLAFHPSFSENGYFYVYYTDRPSNHRINLVRFQVSDTNPNFVDPATATPIFSFIKNQSNSNHNGGKIAFGPDGYLYISVGDGGGGSDPQRNAQNLENAFGSILRIDIDNPSNGNNYGIPEDNPRVGQSGLDELYAWGIRNTWKFSFDGMLLYGADVGQGRTEEINIIQKGGNYGWARYQGDILFQSDHSLATPDDIKPIFSYEHSNGDKSITGGYVYRGAINNSSIQGKYIYGDYISGRVWALAYNPSTGQVSNSFLFRTNGLSISSFGLDESGELYFSSYGSSAQLFKIVDENTESQVIPVNGVGEWINKGGSGTNGLVQALHNTGNNEFIVGGNFSTIDGIAANNLARYDTITGWGAFGNGTNGKVNTIASDNDGTIYVGGDFTEIDGISATNIAFWNGTKWSGLDAGVDGPVSKIVVHPNGNVYVGGVFQNAGTVLVNNIAMWNGSWNPLTDATSGENGTNNEIRSMAIDESGTLLVGGNFDSAGGNPASRIARWDGTTWGALGNGTSGFVEAIWIETDYIYAGGNFAIAGQQTVNRIARWNRITETWESLGFGLSGNVNALAHDGTYLYAGGAFETASDEENVNKIMGNIARWSENSGWQALGTDTDVGTDSQINSLAFSDNKTRLCIGGSFTKAGILTVNNMATWTNNSEILVTGINLNLSEIVLEINESAQLAYMLTPTDATNKGVIWDSSDNGVVTVDLEGTINAINEGNATVTVTTLDGGFQDQVFVVVNPRNRPPEISSFFADPSNQIFIDQQVLFTAIANDPDDDILEYQFNFGDGTSPSIWSIENSITHSFAEEGSYSVEAKVRDSDGNMAEQNLDILVVLPPPATFTLTVMNGSGSGQYEQGQVVDIVADPAPEGQAFDQWTGDSNGIEDVLLEQTTFTMGDEDAAITATYSEEEQEPVTFTLTVVNGSGSGQYEQGQVVDIVADPAPEEQAFDQWTGDVSGIEDVLSEQTTFSMGDENAAITATYSEEEQEPVTFTLTVVNGSGSGQYGQGQVVNIVANPAPEGQVFDQWIGSIKYLKDGSNPATTITIPNKDTEVSAVYVQLDSLQVEPDGILLFPNPAINEVQILGENIYKVSIYNSIGKLIKTIAIEEGAAGVKFETSGMTAGLHFIMMEMEGNEVLLQKLWVR